MAARVKLNHRGMEALLKSSGVRNFIEERAHRVLMAAIDDPHDDSGDYESSLHIEHATTDRAVVRVVASDWKSHIVEANFGVLSRALDAAGGDGGDPNRLVNYTRKDGVTIKVTAAQAANYGGRRS